MNTSVHCHSFEGENTTQKNKEISKTTEKVKNIKNKRKSKKY